MQTLPQPEFKSQRFKSNPFPVYARLREEAPVFRIKVPGNEVGWLVTRYEDVAQVLKHGGISKDRLGSMTPEQQAKLPWFFKFFTPLVQNMLSRDPPDHTRLRALVHKAFTPRLIERLRSRVQTLSDELLDAAARKGSMDLVAEYAFLLPVTIIAEMLGVPPGDYRKFQHWSNRLVSNTDMTDVLLSIPSVVMFTRYLRKLIAQRRTSLGDDLLSALIQAEEAGDKLTPDELVEKVKLPPHLAGYTPYLREYYGTVKHSVRQIYNGYLGWFQGDPVDLDPTPPRQKAERLIALAGGREKLLLEAGNAYLKGDYQWAAELAGYAIRVDHDDKLAREIKARSFRKLGYASMNINWRNWYLMSAMELEGKLDGDAIRQRSVEMRKVFLSPDMVRSFTPQSFLQNWVTRVDPEKAGDIELTLGFSFPDVDEQWALEVRRGVAQLHKGIPEGTALRLSMDKRFMETLLTGEGGLVKGALLGDVKVDGNLLEIRRFLNCFDFSDEAFGLTLR